MSVDNEVLFANLCELGDKLDKLGIRWCLTASTLLGVYRDGEPIGGIPEIDYMVEDITEENKQEIPKMTSEGESEHTIWSFEKNGVKIEVQGVYFVGDVAYKNLVGNSTLIFPKEVYGKFKTKEWHGRQWPIPEDTERWLATYYGDWQTPQPFNWNNAHNLKTLGDVLHIHNFEELMKL